LESGVQHESSGAQHDSLPGGMGGKAGWTNPPK